MGGASSSPAAALPPDDVILEIFFRIPPEPIYLLRVSLVCCKLRHLVRDPAFLRRFRARHCHAAPLLGFFCPDGSFVATGETPDRVAAAHFSRPHGGDRRWRVFGSRHDSVLLSTTDYGRDPEFLVWDPMTGGRIYFPPPRRVQLRYPAAAGQSDFTSPLSLVEGPFIRAVLLCGSAPDHDVGDVCCHSRPFRVVVLFPNRNTLSTSVYCSQTGAWGDVATVNGRWSGMGHWSTASWWGMSSTDPKVMWSSSLCHPKRWKFQTTAARCLDMISTPTGSCASRAWIYLMKIHMNARKCSKDGDGGLGLAAIMGSRLHLFEPVFDKYQDKAMCSEILEIDVDEKLDSHQGAQ